MLRGRQARVRLGALVLLALAAVAAILLLSTGAKPYEVKAELVSASQLVEGNRVTVAGEEAGEVRTIELAPNGRAQITFTVDEAYAPLRIGTQAIVRQLSLSGQASRYIDLQLGGADGEEIPDGGRIPAQDAAAAVDLDQAFAIFDEKTRPNVSRTIKLFSELGAGRADEANAALQYLSPALSASSRLFGELTRDPRALKQFIVQTSRLTNDLAARDDDLAGLVGNLDRTMRALVAEEDALGESIERLPNFMRRANSTFVGLRSTLDDLDPLVTAARPVVRDRLRPLFAQLRPFARDAAPTLRDLSRSVRAPGADNDLIDVLRKQPAIDAIANQPAERNGATRPGAFPATRAAASGATPQIAFLRPYAPDLVGWFDDFSTSGMYDALGGFSRAGTQLSGGSLNPLLGAGPRSNAQREEIFGEGVLFNRDNRCPGSVERPAGDGSNPFRPSPDYNCDPTMVPPGR